MEKCDLLVDLFRAYFDARKNKRNTYNQLKFELDYEHNLFELYEEIKNYRYEIGKSICFIVTHPVRREVLAANFRDRVIHHLIYNYINPLIERQFIPDSYSCRKGKGTLFGIRQLESFLYTCSEGYTQDCYVLKIDIQGYFMNINRDLLHKQLEEMVLPHRYCYCDESEILKWDDCFDFDLVFYLIRKVLFNDPTKNCIIRSKSSEWEGLPKNKSLFHSPEGCGLPIGNLTSQLFSNIYLCGFDHYVKEVLNMSFYGRYVDDCIFVHKDKAVLHEILQQVRAYLRENCALDIHPNKIYLQHYTKGVLFLGAYVKPYRTYVRNRTKGKFDRCVNHWEHRLQHNPATKEDLAKMRASINSYLGILKHHKTYRLRRKVLLDGGSATICRYGYFQKGLNKFCINKRYKVL